MNEITDEINKTMHVVKSLNNNVILLQAKLKQLSFMC